MERNSINVLIVEDNPADARLAVELLKDCPSPHFTTKHAERLEAGLEMLEREWFDVVLLDLGLPDTVGLGGLVAVTARASDVPVIVLTGTDDEDTGVEALNKGATDYLVKGRLDERLLCRSIRYAIERKRIERTLRQSERRWRDLANAMPQMVWTSDADGRCDFVSRRWMEYSGKPEEELLEFGWLESIHPDDRERLLAEWREAAAGPGGLDIELRLRGRDGEYRWHKTSAVAVRDERRGTVKWYGTNADIEEIKRAEHRLGQSNMRLALLASVAGRLLASDDPQRIIAEQASLTMELLGCDVFLNYLVDEDERRLRLNACAGVPKDQRSRFESLDFGTAVCGRAATEARRIVVEEVQRDDDPRTDLVRSCGVRAYACLPLVCGDRVLGTLSFGTRSRDRFSEDDLALMKAVSDHIAIAIDRLRAVDTLRKAESDLNRAQGVAAVGSWRLSVRHNELVWSDEIHRMFGIPRGVQMTYETFLAAVHPDDRGDVDEKWQAALRGAPYDVTHRIIVGGDVRWVRERAELERGADGVVLGGFGTVQDVTERKRAEDDLERSRRWLERVADTTPDIIFVLDIAENRSVYVNRGITDLLGYSPDEFRTMNDVLERTIAPESLARARSFYREMADARPGEVRVLTYRARHKDGRALWLENRVTPFSWDDAGRLVEVIGIGHDVTDQKRAQEVLERDRETFERLVNERTAELVEMHRELQKARHLSDIGMLASTVAHELRNPLGVIRTALYNIERKKQGDALDRHVRTIAKKIEESNQIINNLLMYARIKPPAYETVRVTDLLRESIDSARSRTDRSVTFREESGAVEGVTATLDPYQMAEVLGNILTNAVQAIPAEREGTVTVSARTANGSLLIRVSDTGTGIPPESLPHVFEPFFTSKSKGTGLGLSLCRELVSLHNGSIDIESELGAGTTVSVTLPLSNAARPADGPS
jgi:PAS domain S-box-containing protein